MDIKEKQDLLQVKLVPFIEEAGFRVFEFKIFFSGSKLSLRILVDFKEGGISLEDCSNLSKKVAQYLDGLNLIDELFVLEVFSPGIDRDLVTGNDFMRVKGKLVSLWLTKELEGKSEYQGKILGSDLKVLSLEVGKKNFSIPISFIRKARQKVA